MAKYLNQIKNILNAERKTITTMDFDSLEV